MFLCFPDEMKFSDFSLGPPSHPLYKTLAAQWREAGTPVIVKVTYNLRSKRETTTTLD